MGTSSDLKEDSLDTVEESLVLLKPDAMERRLAGELIDRFERKGFEIAALKLIQVTPELAARHYAQLVDKPFYPEIEAYITRRPIIAMVLRGRNAIAVIRAMVGPTDGGTAPAGTIRGDFALSFRENLIHASDSPKSASREISLFFKPKEIGK